MDGDNNYLYLGIHKFKFVLDLNKFDHFYLQLHEIFRVLFFFYLPKLNNKPAYRYGNRILKRIKKLIGTLS